MSGMYNYICSFFTYYGSFGRSAPVTEVSKLKTLVENKNIFVITEKEIQDRLRSLKKVEKLPKIIEDSRPAFVQELERRFSIANS